MISMDTIRAMSDLIVERFKPERIVLFGSYARGEATEDSDVDLLVELETDPRPNGLGNPIDRLLVEEFMVPLDVIISTPEQVRALRDNPYSLIHQAFAEGRVLYDKRG